MSIKDKLTEHMKEAMKNKDSLKLSVIRLLKSAVKYEEISVGGELDDDKVLVLIQKEIKKRKESVESFRKGGREELASKEEAEMKILLEYLPAQAHEDEIRAVVRRILDEIPEGVSVKMGMIMPKALAALKGRADGKTVGAIVNRELESGKPADKV